MTDEDRAKLDELLAITRELRAELEAFRPVLNMLRPNGGGAVAAAGMRRAARRMLREGQPR